MNDRARPQAASLLRDVASSSEFADLARLLNGLRYLSGSSLRDISGGSHRAVALEVRRQSRSMPTSALHASMHRTLQLLDTRPLVGPQGYAASRRRLGTLMSQRAVADDWIARLQARQRQSRRLGDTQTHTALDAEIQVRKDQRRRLIDRERHAERIVQEHERRLQALYDWQLDHLQQLVQGRWHAQELLDREERALDEVVATPPPYLLSALGAPPRAAEAREIWRQGALAILRFHKDYHIQDPAWLSATRLWTLPGGCAAARSRSSLTRPASSSTTPASRFPSTNRSTSLTSVARDDDLPDREPGRRAGPSLGELGLQAPARAKQMQINRRSGLPNTLQAGRRFLPGRRGQI